MAGPAKKRAQAEKKASGSSDTQQSSRGSAGRRDATQRSSPTSIPRLDGNRDPPEKAFGVPPIDYSQPKDLKNLSDFLGMGGWYVARGVSSNALLFFLVNFHAIGCTLLSQLHHACKNLKCKRFERSLPFTLPHAIYSTYPISAVDRYIILLLCRLLHILSMHFVISLQSGLYSTLIHSQFSIKISCRATLSSSS